MSLAYEIIPILWVVPPPSKSHHQDYYIFSRESQPKPSFATGILGGGTTQPILGSVSSPIYDPTNQGSIGHSFASKYSQTTSWDHGFGKSNLP